ncbi:hypothetical protein WA158_007322 [Blastocystis sp. Blastoise]
MENENFCCQNDPSLVHLLTEPVQSFIKNESKNVGIQIIDKFIEVLLDKNFNGDTFSIIKNMLKRYLENELFERDIDALSRLLNTIIEVIFSNQYSNATISYVFDIYDVLTVDVGPQLDIHLNLQTILNYYINKCNYDISQFPDTPVENRYIKPSTMEALSRYVTCEMFDQIVPQLIHIIKTATTENELFPAVIFIAIYLPDHYWHQELFELLLENLDHHVYTFAQYAYIHAYTNIYLNYLRTDPYISPLSPVPNGTIVDCIPWYKYINDIYGLLKEIIINNDGESKNIWNIANDVLLEGFSDTYSYIVCLLIHVSSPTDPHYGYNRFLSLMNFFLGSSVGSDYEQICTQLISLTLIYCQTREQEVFHAFDLICDPLSEEQNNTIIHLFMDNWMDILYAYPALITPVSEALVSLTRMDPAYMCTLVYNTYSLIISQEKKETELTLFVLNLLAAIQVYLFPAISLRTQLYPFVISALKYIDVNTPDLASPAITCLYFCFSYCPELPDRTSIFCSLDERKEWSTTFLKKFCSFILRGVVSSSTSFGVIIRRVIGFLTETEYKVLARHIIDEVSYLSLPNTVMSLFQMDPFFQYIYLAYPEPYMLYVKEHIEEVSDIFMGIDPLTVPSNDIHKIILKYTNNIHSMFAALFYFNKLDLPVSLVDSLVHIFLCILMSDNKQYSEFTEDYFFRYLYKVLPSPQDSNYIYTSPAGISTFSSSDENEKEKAIHDAVKVPFNPNNLSITYDPIPASTIYAIQQFVQVFYVNTYKSMLADIQNNCVDLSSWKTKIRILHYTSDIFPDIFPIESIYNKYISKEITQLRETFKNEIHPLELCSVLLKYIKGKTFDVSIPKMISLIVFSYMIDGTYLPTDDPTDIFITFEQTRHISMCFRYRQELPVVFGGKHEFLKYVYMRNIQISKFIHCTQINVLLNEKVSNYKLPLIMDTLLHLPLVTQSVSPNLLLDAINPILKAMSHINFMIRSDEIQSMYLNVLKEVKTVAMLRHYIKWMVTSGLFVSYFLSSSFLDYIANPYIYITDKDELSLVNEDTEVINLAIKETQKHISKHLDMFFCGNSVTESNINELFIYFSSILKTVKTISQKLFYVNIFTYLLNISTPRLPDSLSIPLCSLLYSLMEADHIIADNLSVYLLLILNKKIHSFINTYITFLKEKDNIQLFFKTLYSSCTMGTSMLSPELKAIHAWYTGCYLFFIHPFYSKTNTVFAISHGYLILLFNVMKTQSDLLLPYMIKEIEEKTKQFDENNIKSIHYTSILYYASLPSLLSLPSSSPYYQQVQDLHQCIHLCINLVRASYMTVFAFLATVHDVTLYMKILLDQVRAMNTPSSMSIFIASFEPVLAAYLWKIKAMTNGCVTSMFGPIGEAQSLTEIQTELNGIYEYFFDTIAANDIFSSSYLVSPVVYIYLDIYMNIKGNKKYEEKISQFMESSIALFKDNIINPPTDRPICIPHFSMPLIEFYAHDDEMVSKWCFELFKICVQASSSQSEQVLDCTQCISGYCFINHESLSYLDYLISYITKSHAHQNSPNHLMAHISIFFSVIMILEGIDKLIPYLEKLETVFFSPFDLVRINLQSLLDYIYSFLPNEYMEKKVKRLAKILKKKHLTEEQKAIDPQLLKEGAIRELCSILQSGYTTRSCAVSAIKVLLDYMPLPKQYQNIIDESFQILLKASISYRVPLKSLFTEEEWDIITSSNTSLSYFS